MSAKKKTLPPAPQQPIIKDFQPATEAELQECRMRFKATCYLVAQLVLKYCRNNQI